MGLIAGLIDEAFDGLYGLKPIEEKLEMNNPIRQAFEDITYLTLNIAGTKTGHGLRRKENGEYVSDLLEDHWNTFQEGWECAVGYMLNKDSMK